MVKRGWIECDPDPRHAELIVKSLNLRTRRVVRLHQSRKGWKIPQLDASQTRLYRSVVMRAAYLSQDRPYLSFSAKELARDIQRAAEQSITNLKRFGRYLKKRPRLVELFVQQTSTANVVRLDVDGH